MQIDNAALGEKSDAVVALLSASTNSRQTNPLTVALNRTGFVTRDCLETNPSELPAIFPHVANARAYSQHMIDAPLKRIGYHRLWLTTSLARSLA